MKNENRNLRKQVKAGSLIVLLLIAMILVSGCTGKGDIKPIPNTQEKSVSASTPKEISAGSPFEKAIIGRWAKISGDIPIIIQFSSSGMVAMAGQSPDNGTIIARGIYRFKSEDLIEMTYPVEDGSGYYSVFTRVVSVSGTKLVLEDQETMNTATLFKMREDQ